MPRLRIRRRETSAELLKIKLPDVDCPITEKDLRRKERIEWRMQGFDEEPLRYRRNQYEDE